MEQLERNNIFRSYLAEDIFRYDVYETIENHFREHMKHQGIEVTKENLEDAMYEILEDLTNFAEFYLDEIFTEDE